MADETRRKLSQLEQRASVLDPGAATRRVLFERVGRHAEEFLAGLGEMPVYQPPESVPGGVSGLAIDEQGVGLERALELLGQHVDHSGVNVPSGGHLGHIPGGGLYASALGDYLAAVSNRYAGVYYGAPGAVRLENTLLRWLADAVGYPDSAAGNLTSGGSIANLIAVVTAREAHGIRAVEVPDTAVYLSGQTHHSVDKALRVAGLGECRVRRVPGDPGYRMDPEQLERLIREDQRNGVRPWLVVATAGNTDTGAVDPMSAISELAAGHGLWLHVDGAYGAAFVLCETGRKRLGGMERSDSLALDPHKGLFLPFGSGVALVSDGQRLLRAHSYQATYMRDAEPSLAASDLSPAELSPEMSKHFRGLRLWLPLKLFGVAPFRSALEEKLLLARYFHQQLERIDGFEVGPLPDLSVVTFRYLPERGDANEFNQRLVAAVRDDGRVLLTSTVLDGKVTLRAAILGLRTHLQTIELLLEVLREKTTELLRGD